MAAPLTWDRQDVGCYGAVDPEGTRWRVVQAGSHRWEVYENGSDWCSAFSLGEAKGLVEYEVEERLDPELHARREARRAERRARRAAR